MPGRYSPNVQVIEPTRFHRTIAVAALLLLPSIGSTQQTPSTEPLPPIGLQVYDHRPIDATTASSPKVNTTADQAAAQEPLPSPPPQPASQPAEPCPPPDHRPLWPELWGYIDTPGYIAGNRMAPNGVPYDPFFGLNFDFNIGLLPHKQLYFFAENQFWTQKPGAGITNPSQGQFDFSKREYDLDLGLAWNYFSTLELRVEAYALNNLNRGTSLSSPYGFQDGVGLENRFYFGGANPYDLGKLCFVSLGYYPSKSLVAGDGTSFKPGFFGQLYVTYDLPTIRSYLYFDGQFTCEQVVNPRLLEFNGGLAVRPFESFQNLEFRLGYDIIGDVKADTGRGLLYGSIRLDF